MDVQVKAMMTIARCWLEKALCVTSRICILTKLKTKAVHRKMSNSALLCLQTKVFENRNHGSCLKIYMYSCLIVTVLQLEWGGGGGNNANIQSNRQCYLHVFVL